MFKMFTASVPFLIHPGINLTVDRVIASWLVINRRGLVLIFIYFVFPFVYYKSLNSPVTIFKSKLPHLRPTHIRHCNSMYIYHTLFAHITFANARTACTCTSHRKRAIFKKLSQISSHHLYVNQSSMLSAALVKLINHQCYD